MLTVLGWLLAGAFAVVSLALFGALCTTAMAGVKEREESTRTRDALAALEKRYLRLAAEHEALKYRPPISHAHEVKPQGWFGQHES